MVVKGKNDAKHKKNLADYEKYKIKLESLLNYPENKSWVKCEMNTFHNRIMAKEFNIVDSYVVKIDGKDRLECLIEIPDFVEGIAFGQIRESLEKYQQRIGKIISSLRVKYNGNSLEQLIGAFKGCYYLILIDLREFNMAEQIHADNMFDGCENLKQVRFKPQVWQKLLYADKMFKGCESLIKSGIEDISMPNVEDIEEIFFNCQSLRYVDLKFLEEGLKLKKLQGSFVRCAMQEIKFDNIHPENVVDLQNCFQSCENLVQLKFDSQKGCNIRTNNISQMCSHCSSLQNIDFSGLDLSLLRVISQVFRGCQSLKEFKLVEKDLSNLTEQQNLFAECNKLEKVSLINCNMSNFQKQIDNLPQNWGLRQLDITGTDLSQFVGSDGITLDFSKIQEYPLYSQSVRIIDGDKQFRLRIEHKSDIIYSTNRKHGAWYKLTQNKVHTQRIYKEYLNV